MSDKKGDKSDAKPKVKKSLMHNVYTIDIYQRKKVVSTIVRRKSEFKQLADHLEKKSTTKGGKKLSK